MPTIFLQTPYLINPIEDYQHIAFTLDFGMGASRIICDRNICSLGPFGDREVCTLIAPLTTEINLQPLRLADPAGLGRRLFGIGGAPLEGSLDLIVPPNETGDFRLIHTRSNGQRRVISLESVPANIAEAIAYGDDDLICTPLARTVDNCEAQAELRPGFVNDTYFLTIAGKKPNLNTSVKLQPRIYVEQPDYWGFDVLECRRGNIVTPTVSPYLTTRDATENLGSNGVEVFWAGGASSRLDK